MDGGGNGDESDGGVWVCGFEGEDGGEDGVGNADESNGEGVVKVKVMVMNECEDGSWDGDEDDVGDGGEDGGESDGAGVVGISSEVEGEHGGRMIIFQVFEGFCFLTDGVGYSGGVCGGSVRDGGESAVRGVIGLVVKLKVKMVVE